MVWNFQGWLMGMNGGPLRQPTAKVNERQMAMLAHESWTQRYSPEGHEGTTAFREKRKPSWYKTSAA